MPEFDDAREPLESLHDPIMLAAFEGWNDAGDAASSLVTHLAREWDAVEVAAIDPEGYYDFQVNRPKVTGVPSDRRIEWPTTRVLLARGTPWGRDVLLVHGIEPSFRWRAFVDELIEFAAEAGVNTLVSLGAMLAEVPHTRPIPVSVTSDDPDTRAAYDIEAGSYEGPTGIVGILAARAGESALASLSVWAALPHYAGGVPSPKATLALLTKLDEVFSINLPQGDLEESAQAWERGVNELAESDDEVAEYVSSLEQAQDATELPEASGDAIAKEFERYLRGRGDEPKR